MIDELTKKQKEELQKMTNEMLSDVKDVVDDYKKNPSEISGSIVQVNENSPFLKEQFKGDSWKKVIQGSVEDALEHIKLSKNEDEKSEKSITEPTPDEAQILKNIQEKEQLKMFEKVVESRIIDKDGHTLNKPKKK
jgi:hypothetical protein